MNRPADDAGASRWFVPALAAATLTAKLVLAAAFPGYQSGDDLEIVESAARAALGFAYVPWDIRSLFHPVLFVAPFVGLAGVLGFRSAHALTWFATIPTALFSTAGIFLVDRLTRALDGSAATARAAAFLFAFQWLPFAYATMPYPRPISTALLLGAFVLVSRESASGVAAFAAGLAAAAAMTVRWSEGVLLLPLLAFAALRTRRPARVLPLVAGFAVGLLLFAGLFDAVTRGEWFSSLRAFVRYTRDPREWGTDEHRRAWFWYASNLLGWAGPLLVVLAAIGVRDVRARAPLLVAASAVALLSLSPMKQPRYLQAAVPFLAIAAAFGWERLGRWRSGAAAAALLLAVPLCLERSWHLLSHKSMAASAAAEALATLPDPPPVVALEQAWAYGGGLAFPVGTRIRELAPRRPLSPDPVRAAAAGADAVALYAEDSSPEIEAALAERFRPCATVRIPHSSDVVVYLSRSRACAALPIPSSFSAARSGP
jgi:hypothetical protein